MEATAHCGRCDFNFTSHVCTVIRGSHNSVKKEPVEELCSSAEETVHTGSVNTLSFTGNREGATCLCLREWQAVEKADLFPSDLPSLPSFTSYQLIPSYLGASQVIEGTIWNCSKLVV